MKVLKKIVEFATFLVAFCLMSGIDNQMWQAVPALLLLGLLNVEFMVWED